LKEERVRVFAAKSIVEELERKFEVETSRNILLLARAQEEVLAIKVEVESFSDIKAKCEAKRIERLENDLAAKTTTTPKSKRLSLCPESQQQICDDRARSIISQIMETLSESGIIKVIDSLEPVLLRGHDDSSVQTSNNDESFVHAHLSYS